MATTNTRMRKTNEKPKRNEEILVSQKRSNSSEKPGRKKVKTDSYTLLQNLQAEIKLLSLQSSQLDQNTSSLKKEANNLNMELQIKQNQCSDNCTFNVTLYDRIMQSQSSINHSIDALKDMTTEKDSLEERKKQSIDMNNKMMEITNNKLNEHFQKVNLKETEIKNINYQNDDIQKKIDEIQSSTQVLLKLPTERVALFETKENNDISIKKSSDLEKMLKDKIFNCTESKEKKKADVLRAFDELDLLKLNINENADKLDKLSKLAVELNSQQKKSKIDWKNTQNEVEQHNEENRNQKSILSDIKRQKEYEYENLNLKFCEINREIYAENTKSLYLRENFGKLIKNKQLENDNLLEKEKSNNDNIRKEINAKKLSGKTANDVTMEKYKKQKQQEIETLKMDINKNTDYIENKQTDIELIRKQCSNKDIETLEKALNSKKEHLKKIAEIIKDNQKPNNKVSNLTKKPVASLNSSRSLNINRSLSQQTGCYRANRIQNNLNTPKTADPIFKPPNDGENLNFRSNIIRIPKPKIQKK